MRTVIVPEAESQIREIDDWWRENRQASPGLFAQELGATIALIEAWPLLGRRRRHAAIPGLRRVLLRATRYHLYYVPGEKEQLFVLAVWSAVRGRGPRLRAPE